MKKGQKRRIWTIEQKLEIIGKHLNEHISVRTLEKEYNADRITFTEKRFIPYPNSGTFSITIIR